MNSPDKIITHTAVSSKSHNHLDVGRWHFDRWGGYAPSRIRTDIARYCGYHYVILWDGTVEQCRAHDEEGIHCKGQNFSSIGVCFMGNGDIHLPSSQQMKAWWKLLRKLQNEYPVIQNRIYPHRKYANKSCHGKLLSDDYFIKGESDELNLREVLIALITRLMTQMGADRMK